jgi:hypothetical protein
MGYVAPKEVWIDADNFDSAGKPYQEKVRVHADPHCEQFAYPEGYFRFLHIEEVAKLLRGVQAALPSTLHTQSYIKSVLDDLGVV